MIRARYVLHCGYCSHPVLVNPLVYWCENVQCPLFERQQSKAMVLYADQESFPSDGAVGMVAA